MSDLCKHCTMHGNFEKCEQTDCSIRDHWYVLELRLKLRAAQEEIKLAQKEMKNLYDDVFGDT